MQSRDLRPLLEFAPSRTEFNQILNDTTIQMGFECEMVTDREAVQGSEAPEYDNWSWGQVENNVHISSRTQGRIEDEYSEWLSTKVHQWLDDKWGDEENEYVLKWCVDNGHLAKDADVDVFASETERALRKLGFTKIAKSTEYVSNKTILFYIKEPISDEQMEELNNLVREQFDHFDSLRIEKRDGDITTVIGDLSENPDEIIDAYRDDARSDFDDEYREEAEEDIGGGMDEFIEDEYSGRNTRLMDAYNIDYDTDSDEEVDAGSVYDDMAYNLRDIVSKPVNVSSYHQDPNAWYIDEDGSLEGDGYVTAEVISAVYPLAEGLEMLNLIFEWMDDNNYTTNESTGLHVSFSIEGFDTADDYDFLKMMVLFDENYTADLFDRLGAIYAQQMRNVLFSKFANVANPIASMSSRQIADTIVKLHRITQSMQLGDPAYGGNSSFGESKYFSFRHRAHGVVEFRSMGGQDYEKKYDIIRKRIVNMAYLMKVGSDPMLMAREYITRIYKMLTSTKFKNPELGSAAGHIETPFALSAFQSIFDRHPELLKTATSDPLNFFSDLAERIQAKEINVGPTQIRQLRFFAAKMKLTVNLARDYFKNDSQYNIIANLMRWPLVVPGDQDERQVVLPFARMGKDLSGGTPPRPPDDEEDDIQERYRERHTQGGLGDIRNNFSFRG